MVGFVAKSPKFSNLLNSSIKKTKVSKNSAFKPILITTATCVCNHCAKLTSREPLKDIQKYCSALVNQKQSSTTEHTTQLYRKGLHDNSANNDSAINKMAARFWLTDDSATFLFEKKAKICFLPLTAFT